VSDWKSRLTSRKLWLAIGGFATSILVMIGAESATVERVVALIMAAGSLVAFIFTEGWADAERAKHQHEHIVIAEPLPVIKQDDGSVG
jgi:hypothetical protein